MSKIDLVIDVKTREGVHSSAIGLAVAVFKYLLNGI